MVSAGLLVLSGLRPIIIVAFGTLKPNWNTVILATNAYAPFSGEDNCITGECRVTMILASSFHVSPAVVGWLRKTTCRHRRKLRCFSEMQNRFLGAGWKSSMLSLL